MKSNYRGQGTLIKVVSLAVGLTVGLVLIAKVHLEMNYDRQQGLLKHTGRCHHCAMPIYT